LRQESAELWIIRDPPDGLLEMLAAGGELPPLTAVNAVTARHQPDRQRSAAVLLERYSRLAWASVGRQGI
jgi:hypothetical protein